jgi:putative proteasome-type protease
MTYCLGMLLHEGLIMMADTRTNAGVDNFSSYRKLVCLHDEPDRQVYAAASGNLSISQTAISLIREGVPAGDEMSRTLSEASSMFRAAQLVGEALQVANKSVGEALASIKMTTGASMLLGGRIGTDKPSLYLIYEAGNFIECQAEVPFFQIGETKYGRPILDRTIRPSTPLAEAVKIGFLSFDSAMRSNLGVARPIDLMVMPKECKDPIVTRRIEASDAYFNELSTRWSALLHDATRSIPDPPFMTGEG